LTQKHHSKSEVLLLNFSLLGFKALSKSRASTCSIFQLEAWPTPRHNQELNKALQNQEEFVKHCYKTAPKRLPKPNLLNTSQPTQTLKTKTKMPHPTLVNIATKILLKKSEVRLVNLNLVKFSS
jgi:hypothetical protein